MARFRVRQPSNALVRTSYQPGAVMAGLTTKIEVELMASVPCVIGADGLERIIEVELDDAEQKAFDASVEHVRTLVSQIDL